MNVAVIGAGSIGQRHVKGLAGLRDETGVRQIRVFDPNADRCAAAAAAAADVVACSSLDDAMRGAGAAFICAPTSLHADVAQEVVGMRSAHIFMEKPLGSSAKGWAELIDRQKRAGKVFAVGYMLRKHPVLRRLKALLDQETFGRVLHARAESGFYLPYWHPHEDYRAFYMAWRTGGGGALLDTSHEIDYLTWLFGPVANVQGSVETISDLEITSDDLVLATFGFKSGVRGQVQLDLLQFDEARYCKVICAEGVVKADFGSNSVTYWKKGATAWETEKLSVAFDDIYANEYRDFLAACRGEAAEIVTGGEALHVMEIIEAVRHSHAFGTTVRLPLWFL